MRWKREYIRCVRRFAFFPVEIGDDIRWLEIVYLVQEYGHFTGWRNIRYGTKKEYVEYKRDS